MSSPKTRQKPKPKTPLRSRGAEDRGGTATHRPFQALAKQAKRRAGSPAPTQDPAADATRVPTPPPSTPKKTPERFADLVPYVTPLQNEKRRVPKTSRPPRTQSSEHRFEVIDDGHCVEGRRIDVDPRDLGRLKRGELACDARLDLHGLGATEARAKVETFVARSAREGAKVAEIIHGKGRHSVAGVGVLRGELGAWLSQGAAAAVVLAFASIRDARGEVGRLRVLLAPPRR